ncbi:MAG: glutamate-1-semialdehyde-2,1-aminomutase [Elusimicrobia bacterium CG08_land_8_20_14_0_20_59_10]|nr:MAG: glutamate-1-semialdehyde-2,1-aminomutase [Elusimicrobia bacterium CG08_land_8_20_14_0_20_59_10]
MKLKTSRSKKLWAYSLKHLAGGVNSPVRAFNAVGGTPLFIRSAKGSRLSDVDGNSYLDYVLSWGVMIHGHADPDIQAALSAALSKGTSYGAPTEAEAVLAEMIKRALPSIEKLRFVSSGTEAVMSAIRLARGYTGRDKIVKFTGCYHGHADSLLVKAGSGAATFGSPSSPGVPAQFARNTVSLEYNDTNGFLNFMKRRGGEVACVIVEPIAANMGLVLPAPGFLAALRKACTRGGALLLFDEVITGFRVGFGGAQGLYRIKPDLTTLGKIIGGGLPVGAYGGREEIMRHLSPAGRVYQAGTLSGNPLAMAAGCAALKKLSRPGFYKKLEASGRAMEEGLRLIIRKGGLPLTLNRAGSLFTLFFSKGPLKDWTGASACDTKRYAKYFWAMAERGVYLPPSQFETCFISAAHSAADIRGTLKAADQALRTI